MADVQKKLQALSDSYQGLQAGKAFALLTNSLVNLGTELGTAVEARQKLESQQQENSTVKKEFDILDDDANIYKQIGPVLLKQDKTEAVMSVNGRLEFIDKQIKDIEKQIQGIQDKSEKIKGEPGALTVMSPNDSDSDHDYNSSYDDEINLEEQESEEQEWNTPSSPGDMLLNNKQPLAQAMDAEEILDIMGHDKPD
ncbi:unnamed protein product [Alternaria alternata]